MLFCVFEQVCKDRVLVEMCLRADHCFEEEILMWLSVLEDMYMVVL